MGGGALTTVYFVRLGSLIPVQGVEVSGDEVEAIRGLYCAADRDTADRYYRRWDNCVQVPAADADRWHAATETILRAMDTVREEQRVAGAHLYPPYVSAAGRLLWRARHGRRNARLRAGYDTTMRRLREDVLAAYRGYRDRAADLTELVAAERERRERDKRARERRERAERAAAMTGAAREAVWAYGLTDGEHRRFEIHLRPFARHAPGLVRSHVTAAQVHAALADERARHPGTVVRWSYPTRLALEEWHRSGDARLAWQAITGSPIELYPPAP